MKRREKVRRAMRKTREKKKTESNTQVPNVTINNENNDQNENRNTEGQEQTIMGQEEIAGPCDSTTNPIQQLHVKMNFKTPGKKKNKAVAKANRRIKDLQSQIETMRRSNERIRKKLYRQNMSISKHSTNSPCSTDLNDTSTLTPRRRVKSDLRSAGIPPSKPNARLLKKKLEFQYTVLDQVKQNFRRDLSKSKQHSQLRIFCGNLIRKYRLEARLSSNLGIPRKRVINALKTNDNRRRRLPEKRINIVNKVLTFLQRDDNSTCLPGKADAVKVTGVKQQKRVLNDYLYNLHLKFLSENKDINISLSVFNRIRPKNFQLVKFSNRKTCLLILCDLRYLDIPMIRYQLLPK